MQVIICYYEQATVFNPVYEVSGDLARAAFEIAMDHCTTPAISKFRRDILKVMLRARKTGRPVLGRGSWRNILVRP